MEKNKNNIDSNDLKDILLRNELGCDELEAKEISNDFQRLVMDDHDD